MMATSAGNPPASSSLAATVSGARPPVSGAAATAPPGGASAAAAAGSRPRGAGDDANVVGGHRWEDTSAGHLWDHVQEDESGNLLLSGEANLSLVQAIRLRRKRMETTDYAQRNRRVVRDMIRYLYVVLDASRGMRQKDGSLTPGTLLDVAVNALLEFVQEYYDQNPLSHLGFVLVQNGEAEILSPLSSSSARAHRAALQSVLEMAASEASQPGGGGGGGGEFSLQNGLEVAGRSLGHQPRHGSREVLILTAALSTCDPGSILSDTLPKLRRSRIRVSCFALLAELYVCTKLTQETKGTMGVCLNKAHLRDWMHNQCIPPPATATGVGRDEAGDGEGADDDDDADPENRPHHKMCEMIPMGFPTRTTGEVATLVHAPGNKTVLARTSYTCPQCQAKNLELPTDCAVCGLKLVLAPHLARSFHHLFPVATFVERPIVPLAATTTSTAPSSASGDPIPSSSMSNRSDPDGEGRRLLVNSRDDDLSCYACLTSLVVVTNGGGATTPGGNPPASASTARAAGVDVPEVLRFQCPDCRNYFCVDCDAYLHETLHNCPGCLRR